MVKLLRLKNGTKVINFSGNAIDKEIEVEIEDDMNDYYAYTYLTKKDLIAIKEHIDSVLKQM